MASLSSIREFLDESLRTTEIKDYPGAVNGLQLENSGQVTKVIAAVDASLPVIEKAVAAGGDLLVVHHGLFWQGAQPLVAANYRKIKAAMDAGLAIYSSHLPLDVHAEWGNNVGLAQAMGLADWVPFFDQKGMPLGLRAEVDWSLPELLKRVEIAVGSAVHHCPGGSERIGSVGIITGGAGSEVAEVAETGVDAFVTGEGPHWSYPLAEELGIHLVYGGHYATETFGVKRLAEELAKRFQLESEFLDHPTGL